MIITNKYFILYEVYCNGLNVSKNSFDTDITVDTECDAPSKVMENIHIFLLDKVKREQSIHAPFNVVILNIINLNSLFNITGK